ncbi:MAG: PAS domain S-box protein [Chloroflexota bacterium]
MKTKLANNGESRLGASDSDLGRLAGPAGEATPSADHLLDEVESVARIGSYSMDIASGRWVSSKGLDAIFGIDARFDRTVAGWAGLIHPADRERMLAYFTDEVLGHGQRFDKQYRIVRADTGEERWVHGRGALEFDAAGQPLRMLGTIADITEQRRVQDALIRSERRYATIFEGAREAILIVEQPTERVRWSNPAACALLGYTRGELVALSVRDLLPPDGLPAALEGFHSFALAEGLEQSASVRRKDGTIILADISVSATIIDEVPSAVAFLSDVTERHRLEARDHKLAQAIAHAKDAILITGPAAEIEYANPAFERLSGRTNEQLVGGHPRLLGGPQSPGVAEAMWRTISTGASWAGDLVHRRPDGTDRVAEASISPVRDADGTVAGFVAIERDLTEERARSAERARLTAAIEHASDLVMITDLEGTVEYVNPAFEQVSGYRREEVIGQNPRILKSGLQPAAFYRTLWRHLTAGQTWTGTMINRRKDGSLYQQEGTISPIRTSADEITGYVAVNRDVTALRAAESSLANEFRERAAVAAALARLQPGATARETALLICDELVGLPGVDVAGVIDFLDPGRAVSLAVAGPDGLPFATGQLLPATRAKYLQDRAAQGPWAETLRPRPEDGRYGQMMAEVGMRAMAYAPIRNGDGLLGVVAVGTCDEAYARHMTQHLPIVGEFAATASALLSRQLERGHRDVVLRERIGRVLGQPGFSPVFQPIVEIESATTVGYEALTRFADGTPPDRMFDEAQAVGLGLDLEVACLAAALDASQGLPRDAWLSLNASPHLILHPGGLPVLLAGQSRQIVIEVTEHAEVADYAAVRRAVAALGPNVSLAVDDAGAGFASLRHVVELTPQFLKVDISLVRHVDRDLTRQAMIAGLRHFAARVGCELIAEGIEEPAELEMLRELGVPLGQGYLLGRPEPLPALADGAERSGPSDRANRPRND